MKRMPGSTHRPMHHLLRHPRLALLAAALTLTATLAPAAQSPADHPLPTNPPTTPDTLTPISGRPLAPDFTLPTSNGRPFHLAQNRGHVVVLNFWATWCGGCKFELPYFVEYDRKYRAQGLTTLGISMDDGGFPTVRPFWSGKHMPYPTVIGNDAFAKQFGLRGMPFTLLIDRQGRIAIAHAGVLDRADFDRHLQTLLAESPRA